MVARLMDESTLADVMREEPVSTFEVSRIQGVDGEGI
jgi:hypothetical protein